MPDKQSKHWATCATCGRFLKLVKGELPNHTKSSGKFSPPNPSEKEQHNGK
jgi:hypothetical protein